MCSSSYLSEVNSFYRRQGAIRGVVFFRNAVLITVILALGFMLLFSIATGVDTGFASDKFREVMARGPLIAVVVAVGALFVAGLTVLCYVAFYGGLLVFAALTDQHDATFLWRLSMLAAGLLILGSLYFAHINIVKRLRDIFGRVDRLLIWTIGMWLAACIPILGSVVFWSLCAWPGKISGKSDQPIGPENADLGAQ